MDDADAAVAEEEEEEDVVDVAVVAFDDVAQAL